VDESTWLSSTAPLEMLAYLKGKVSDRKLRLFACACRRQVPLLPWDGRSQGWQHVEDHPEEPVPVEGVPSHFIPALEHAALFLSDSVTYRPEKALAASLLREIVGNPFRPLPEVRAFGGLMKIGWLTDTVLALAEPIYEERAFDRMPILADAVEEAGCTNRDILHHCRGRERCWDCGGTLGHRVGFNDWCPCPTCQATGWMPLRSNHVRGCWVLDLILGYG
jgi:hypothetical protein